MCCRYLFEETPQMREFLEEMCRSSLAERWKDTAEIASYGEIYPSNIVPVIAPNRSGERAVFPMKWGYTGRSLLVNARAETAAQKPTFREDWARHRCIVPASWYYEWQHLPTENGKRTTSVRYAIQPKDAKVTWLCGLYRIENGLPCFVILTREPSPDVSRIHDRMPLILPRGSIRDWINPDIDPAEVLPQAVTGLAAERDPA